MLRLYDTRTGRIEPISSAARGMLRMYSCGPTADRFAHLGDFRAYLLSDLIRRIAEQRGWTVVACQDIYDIGGRADAGPAGDASPLDARSYEAAFRADCTALNIRPPEYAPRACESIELITDMIAKLIQTGHAYPVGHGGIYFDARSFPGYGDISGHQPGTDWLLWRGADADADPYRARDRQRAWTAPWGTGFPARTAACAAISLHCLGEVIDIHADGIDLRFPHHEQERAQVNSVTGRDVVRHWVHAENLRFDRREDREDAEPAGRSTGQPAGQSAGQVVRLADLTARGIDPLAARLACLEQQYRQPLDLTWDTLVAADATLRRWRQQVAGWADAPSRPADAAVTGQVSAALDNDLDTPAALGVLRRLEADDKVAPGSKFETFVRADQVLALDLPADIGRPPPR